MPSSVGITRNKTHLIFEYKVNRSSRQSLVGIGVISDPVDPYILIQPGQSTSKISIELQVHSNELPVGWANNYEECLERIEQIQKISIQKNQQQNV